MQKTVKLNINANLSYLINQWLILTPSMTKFQFKNYAHTSAIVCFYVS